MLIPELGAALTLLTRLPAGGLMGSDPVDPARAVWAYPVVGALVGATGAGVDWVCLRLGFPPGMAAFWIVAALVLLTGGASMRTGWPTPLTGSGAEARDRKLEIMRDSRIGSYGALALVLSTGLRVTALALLATPERVGPALIAAGALSRGTVALPLSVLRPARADGLAAPLLNRAMVCNCAAVAIAAGVALAMLSPVKAVVAVGASALVAGAVTGMSRRQIGGYTGDVLGACVSLVECAVLSVLVAG